MTGRISLFGVLVLLTPDLTLKPWSQRGGSHFRFQDPTQPASLKKLVESFMTRPGLLNGQEMFVSKVVSIRKIPTPYIAEIEA
ncbi:hypothetical protein EAF00_003075 [Botryotinia globosa]|nr:hypothetical protein EAF00_003075 [Botryotinia globosa]